MTSRWILLVSGMALAVVPAVGAAYSVKSDPGMPQPSARQVQEAALVAREFQEPGVVASTGQPGPPIPDSYRHDPMRPVAVESPEVCHDTHYWHRHRPRHFRHVSGKHDHGRRPCFIPRYRHGFPVRAPTYPFPIPQFGMNVPGSFAHPGKAH